MVTRRNPKLILTKRELEVLDLVKLGSENKQIATKLGIGICTVKAELKNAFSKLGAFNRTQAVYICLREGLLRL